VQLLLLYDTRVCLTSQNPELAKELNHFESSTSFIHSLVDSGLSGSQNV
jgi:hypothetical protein